MVKDRSAFVVSVEMSEVYWELLPHRADPKSCHKVPYCSGKARYSGSIIVQNIIDEGWEKPELAPEHPEEEEVFLIFENGTLITLK